MAFTGNFICNSFKQELLVATHNFTASTGDTFKLALYTSAATLTASTTVYSATNETSGTNYTAGGAALTSITPVLSSSTAVCDFNDLTFSSVSITARGALIYNSSKTDKAVAVLDFGSDKTASAGNFTIVFPTADASNAIIRIA
jgi:hypothetical protein